MAYMGYEAADLLPLVQELTERYTSKASTSVPWETAQQLMEAVLYCIGETQETGSGPGQKRELSGGEMLTAREAYDLGYRLVIRRTEEARKLYNKWIVSFNGYGCSVYRKTVTRNIPGFFKWYDPRFNPQQDFTGQDYPVPGDLGKRPGIDRVDRYLACIWAEQRFLGSLSPDYVGAVLTARGQGWRDLPVNLGEIVLRKILVHLLLGISPEETALEPDKYEMLAAAVGAVSGDRLAERVRGLSRRLAARYFPGDEALAAYLDCYIPGIAAELANGAAHGCLQRIV